MWCTFFSSSAVLFLLFEVIKANPTSARNNTSETDGGIQFHIVHTNDMHARFEQTSKLSATCSDSEAAEHKCYGGFARIATLVRNARAGNTPTLFLNAGDNYHGTRSFVANQWKIVARFLSILNPDAVSLGNHEFDYGIDGLIPFINNVSFPVLAANLNITSKLELNAKNFAKSAIININGTEVGLIGYVIPVFTIKTGNVIFRDEIAGVSEEAKRLKKQGVNILIALGHSGYAVDQKIAAEVEDIDLVVGAHSHTFLYNGTQPDSETPEGLYPTVITQSNGRKVYVVQAYAYTKYLGNLSVTFDSEGELTHFEGNPILVDSSIEQAADVLEELEKWRDEMNKINMINTIVGNARVYLDGSSESCRCRECTLGNLLTDALIDYNLRHYTESQSNGWTDAAIAIVNSGAIKSYINKNRITIGHVLDALPFNNRAVILSLTGKKILQMLEWSVYDLIENSTDKLKGGFLQLSGIQVTYNLTQPANSKVVSVQVRCANCSVPEYSDLKETESYSVITTDYIYEGGDNYTMLSGLPFKAIDANLSDILIDYLGNHNPVYSEIEGRITFSNTPDGDSGASMSLIQ